MGRDVEFVNLDGGLRTVGAELGSLDANRMGNGRERGQKGANERGR